MLPCFGDHTKIQEILKVDLIDMLQQVDSVTFFENFLRTAIIVFYRFVVFVKKVIFYVVIIITAYNCKIQNLYHCLGIGPEFSNCKELFSLTSQNLSFADENLNHFELIYSITYKVIMISILIYSHGLLDNWDMF